MASKKKASSSSFGGILAVVAVIGVGAIGYIVSRPAKVVTLDPSVAPVAAAGFVKGSPDALVEVVEFADFECGACGYFATITEPDVMTRLVESGEIRFRFMDFPLTDIHPNSVAAHSAAHCASEQGKFWEMHDGIFAQQDKWATQATRSPKKVLEGIAKAVGLDMSQWNDCFDTNKMLPQIAANRNEGNRLRVGSTPTFIIGGRVIPGNISFDQFNQYVTQAKVEALAKQSEAIGGPASAPNRRP